MDRRWTRVSPLLLAAVLGAVLIGVAVVARLLRDDTTRRAAIGPSTVVLLGDSLTEFGPWDDLLPDHEVANRGHAGFTTEQLIPVAAEVAEARPRTVVVLTGTNDIRDDHPPEWTVERLGLLLDRLADAAPDTEVLVQTIPPRADAADQVVATNRAIVALAGARGLQVLDLHQVLDDGSGGLRTEDTTDGVHLTPQGYERWAELLRAVL